MLIAALLMFLCFACLAGLFLGAAFYLVGSLSQAEDEQIKRERELLCQTVTQK